MPAFGFFILPFGVAGDRARYLRMLSALLMKGMPVNWLLCAASMSILMVALKNALCMYFIDFVSMGVCTRMHWLYVRWIVVYLLKFICSMLQADVLVYLVLGLSSDL